MNEDKSKEKEEKINPLENLKRFGYGGLALQFSQNKGDENYIVGALDMFAGDYLNDEVVKTFVDATYSSPEATENALKIASTKYLQNLTQSTGKDLSEWYKESLNSLDEEERSKMEEILTEHEDKTLEEIQKEIQKAEYILQNPEKDKVSEEEQEKATKSKEKYEKFLLVQQTLEKYRMEELRNPAIEKAKKRNLSGLVSRLSQAA